MAGTDRTDKINGSILSLAIGDALGAAIEGLSAGRIADLFGQLRDFSQLKIFYSTLNERTDLSEKSILNHLRRRRMPGLYTDDTQQALVIIECLIDRQRPDRVIFAKKIVECIQQTRSDGLPLGAFRGYGPGFYQVAINLLKGVSVDRAGVFSAGNGAAMRIAPVGLFYHEDPSAAGRGAVEFSVLTHHDLRACLSAGAIAIGVSLAVSADAIDSRKNFFQLVIDGVRDLSKDFKDYPALKGSDQQVYRDHFLRAMENLKPHLSDSYETAARAVQAFASEITGETLSAESPFCLCSVLMSFWHFLHYRDSAEEAIVSAVNRGGDTDTIGAMTGALAGALAGESAIPFHWKNDLINRKQILLRAEGLRQRTARLPDWKSFPDMELELTISEMYDRNKILQAKENRSE